MTTRDSRCPSCAAASKFELRTRDRNRHLSAEWFSYFRCLGCDLLYLDPIPADLQQFYPRTYYALPKTPRALRRRSRPERFKLEIVQRFKTGGSLLEIGPAQGAFALLAREAGFRTTGIEMDQGCCAFLSETVGIDVIESADPARALESLRGFDVVVLWHSLEHLPNPRQVIAAAARSLAPGGVLVVATPNPLSFQFRVLGRYWTHVDAPRHLYLISPPLARRWAEESGLDQEYLTTTDMGSLGWNRFGWSYSFASFSSFPPARLALRVAGAAATLLARSVERRDLGGSTYTAVFRKPQ